mmetsp:Transcript_27438/g.46225  ORF Transcript_27438/g.46225 Transcript_27438/m.46225 type:complete len:595 (-) Transcript_27438:319-2103(-)
MEKFDTKMVILRYIKDSLASCFFELITDDEGASNLNEMIVDSLRSSFQTAKDNRHYSMESNDGEMILFKILKSLRMYGWNVLTSNTYTHGGSTHKVESTFYFEKVLRQGLATSSSSAMPITSHAYSSQSAQEEEKSSLFRAHTLSSVSEDAVAPSHSPGPRTAGGLTERTTSLNMTSGITSTTGSMTAVTAGTTTPAAGGLATTTNRERLLQRYNQHRRASAIAGAGVTAESRRPSLGTRNNGGNNSNGAESPAAMTSATGAEIRRPSLGTRNNGGNYNSKEGAGSPTPFNNNSAATSAGAGAGAAVVGTPDKVSPRFLVRRMSGSKQTAAASTNGAEHTGSDTITTTAAVVVDASPSSALAASRESPAAPASSSPPISSATAAAVVAAPSTQASASLSVPSSTPEAAAASGAVTSATPEANTVASRASPVLATATTTTTAAAASSSSSSPATTATAAATPPLPPPPPPPPAAPTTTSTPTTTVPAVPRQISITPDTPEDGPVRSATNPLGGSSSSRPLSTPNARRISSERSGAAASVEKDPHEISKTNHYSRLGSAFFGGNSLSSRGSGRGGGRGSGSALRANSSSSNSGKST